MADEKDKKKKGIRERLIEFFLKSPTVTGVPDATAGMKEAMATVERRNKKDKRK